MTITHDLDLPALGQWGRERVPTALFWTISGSHLYGFPSVDSDIDLRGCFLAPLRAIVGLRQPAETVEPKGEFEGREVEAVSHEVGKYLRLMCKHNGYVLEQVFSPLVAFGADFLARLRPLAAKCVTKHCHNHYRGFLHTQRKLFEKEEVKRAKTLLYAYRVALTGVHLLETRGSANAPAHAQRAVRAAVHRGVDCTEGERRVRHAHRRGRGFPHATTRRTGSSPERGV